MNETKWRELEEPERVAEMSGPELNALRTANNLIAAQSERVAHESRLLEAVAWRKNALMGEIASRHELPVDTANFTLDDDTGAIFRTAVLEEVETLSSNGLTAAASNNHRDLEGEGPA